MSLEPEYLAIIRNVCGDQVTVLFEAPSPMMPSNITVIMPSNEEACTFKYMADILTDAFMEEAHKRINDVVVGPRGRLYKLYVRFEFRNKNRKTMYVTTRENMVGGVPKIISERYEFDEEV